MGIDLRTVRFQCPSRARISRASNLCGGRGGIGGVCASVDLGDSICWLVSLTQVMIYDRLL